MKTLEKIPPPTWRASRLQSIAEKYQKKNGGKKDETENEIEQTRGKENLFRSPRARNKCRETHHGNREDALAQMEGKKMTELLITAKNSVGELALQKHLNTKLNPVQNALKKKFFSEKIERKPLRIRIGFKAPARAVMKAEDFVNAIKQTLEENGATKDDYEIKITN